MAWSKSNSPQMPPSAPSQKRRGPQKIRIGCENRVGALKTGSENRVGALKTGGPGPRAQSSSGTELPMRPRHSAPLLALVLCARARVVVCVCVCVCVGGCGRDSPAARRIASWHASVPPHFHRSGARWPPSGQGYLAVRSLILPNFDSKFHRVAFRSGFRAHVLGVRFLKFQGPTRKGHRHWHWRW
jgi:hypothetical protein